MAKGCVGSISKAQCAIFMTPLKLISTSFLIHCRISIFENILFLSNNLDYKHAEPNIGKTFKTNITLTTRYLNLNCNIQGG